MRKALIGGILVEYNAENELKAAIEEDFKKYLLNQYQLKKNQLKTLTAELEELERKMRENGIEF